MEASNQIGVKNMSGVSDNPAIEEYKLSIKVDGEWRVVDFAKMGAFWREHMEETLDELENSTLFFEPKGI